MCCFNFCFLKMQKNSANTINVSTQKPNTIKTNWTTEKFRSHFQKKKKNRNLEVKFLQNHTV